MTLKSTLENYFAPESENGNANSLIDELIEQSRKKLDAGLRLIRRPEAAVASVASGIGPLMIAVGPRGLLMLRFLKQSADAAMGLAALRLKFDPVPDERPAHEIGAEIARFLDGDRQALRSRIDLSLTNGEFEHAVLKALYEVPRGALLSYQGLGASVGAPRAARAVGNVMHNNPVPVYVPCHQVICSDGSIGNYGGGVETKIRLLRAEGFAIGSKHQLAGDAVWGHRKSRIFCRPSCPAARRADSANFMIFANHNAAAKSGMRPCKVCRPG